jgi:hypothetical protein
MTRNEYPWEFWGEFKDSQPVRGLLHTSVSLIAGQFTSPHDSAHYRTLHYLECTGKCVLYRKMKKGEQRQNVISDAFIAHDDFQCTKYYLTMKCEFVEDTSNHFI